MKDLLIIGIFGFVAYEFLLKPKAAALPVGGISAMPVLPGGPSVGNAATRPAGSSPLVAGPLMSPTSGGGGGGGGTVPTYRDASGGGYDPFNTDFFNGTGWWGSSSGGTYRQQYPVKPGVIEAGGGEEIGLDYDY